MKQVQLRHLIFMTLCCDLGLFTKRLIAPIANIITDALHIPGGIGTSFSLMFLVIGAILMPNFGCATIMALVQSVLALALGMVGSMGVLSPIGYIVPAIVIDCVILIRRIILPDDRVAAVFANMFSAASACLTANAIVFRLRPIPLLLYVSVAMTSGAVCGFLAGNLLQRLKPVLMKPISTKLPLKIQW